VPASKDLLVYLTRSLVRFPEEVIISETQEGETTLLRIKVHPEDMGRLIGRSGRTAKAVRELVGKAAACNNEGKVQVLILEEDQVVTE
jgi:predicted RNA-binding protein YlqC (UPF0109 family)